MSAALLLAAPALVRAGTYYVDGSSSSATDSGAGSSSQPFKTISGALSARGAAGNTLVVRPAIYRETATISASGTSSSPMVLQASGPGVVVAGSDDFSGTSKWNAFSGNVYLASSVTWAPLQVFADGARLAPSTASPSSLPANAFVYVSGAGLYVNLGGANPGSHRIEVGHRANCFRVSGGYVTIDGFEVRQSEDYALYVPSTHDVTAQNCTVTFSNHYGIDVNASSAVRLIHNVTSDNNDHGIYVNASTGCLLRGNECMRNARPAVRAANGIDVNNSPQCTLENNRCHDNQDSGIQFYNGSNGGLSRDNLSWRNGDHGFDHLGSTGVRHYDDVAYGNYKDGFSIEGNASGCSLFDCIAIDNGLTTGEYDLWVDSASSIGFVSDYNIFWNSTSQAPIKYVTVYSTIASYQSASQQDAHSLQVDPRFVNAANGDFHLASGSRAIDSGTSSGSDWPATDIDGTARYDDPATSNTGSGPVAFADRGALEYSPTGVSGGQPPVVSAPASVAGTEGSVVTVNVTASDPTGAGITSLTADLSALPAGNNAAFTTNAAHTTGTLTWRPGFSDSRDTPYHVTFKASNGLSASASTDLTIRDSVTTNTNIVTNPGFETDLHGWTNYQSASLSRVTPGRSGSYCAQIRASSSSSKTFGIMDSPRLITNIPGAGISYRFSAWVRSASSKGTVKFRIREFVGSSQIGVTAFSPTLILSTSWQQITLDYSTRTKGSYIDIQINDYPVSSGESFLLDDVSIVRLGTAPQPAEMRQVAGGGLAFESRVVPNPMPAGGELRFVTTRAGAARVEVLDVAGRSLGKLLDEPNLSAGRHALAIGAGTRLAPGTYFYRLEAAEGVRGGRFVVIR